MKDILSVEEDENLAPALDLGESLIMKVSKLKVVDIIDQLPLVPSKSVLTAIFDAPIEWHRNWHSEVDRIQLASWRKLPTGLAATLGRSVL